MIRRYLWTLNVLFLLGFSYFVADLVNLFIGRQLELPPPAPTVSITTTEAQVRPTMEIYSSIVERNIFGTKPSAAIGPPEEARPQPVPLPPLRVRLVGTIVGESEESLAVIEDLATKEQRLYHLEDLVGTDAKLIAITRNEVTFLRGDIRETLGLQEEGVPGQPAVSFPVPILAPAPPAIRPAGVPNNWILDKHEVTAALEDLPQLMTKARVVPNLTPEGKSDGFRIVSISPASFYERIGLRNGDVIQRINGVEVKDPQTFMQVFTQLREQSNITLDLLRNNQKESFAYEIR
ncbi:MAG: PDZ domain-containing protein [Nitrospirae bacterium]|nr:PDZ domain-containing protein [Nitrospirota bacterium]